ncbi:MAG: complex I subunit 5 family protein [Halobacteriaceae archaeon]
MSPTVVAAPLLVALVTGVVALVVRGPRGGPAVSLAGGVAYVAAVAALVAAVLGDPDGVLVYQLGDWPAPFGIVLVADALSAFMLALSAPVALVALAVGTRQRAGDDRSGQTGAGEGGPRTFHALYHFVLVGVTGAVLTGDVFNLFVWFEVMLMGSYVLVVYHGGAHQTRATLRYLVLNLVGSAVMLLAIGGLYATTGTLNMADLARRFAEPAAYGIETAPVLGLVGLLFAVFALKAGAVPFQFWVPGAYRAAPPAVAALLAGVTKKVGVYAIIRLAFTVLGTATIADAAAGYLGGVLTVLATASVVGGGLAAIDRDSLEGLFAYSSIGQVGFILLPLAVAAGTTGPVRALGVAAALVYALNHALAKSLLFLAAGTVRDATGTTRFGRLGGLAGQLPLLSGAVFVGALALVGIPPLSGFFAKLLVFDAAVGGRAWGALAVALAGALLTVAYVSRAWNRGFWGQPTPYVERAAVDPVQVAGLGALALALLAVGVGFDPVFTFAERAAAAALDTQGYVDAVLGGGA